MRLQRWYAAGAILALLYGALLVAQAATRRPWTDEAIFADAALTLITKGYLGCPVVEFATAWPNIARHVYTMFPLDLIVLAGWFRIAGFGLIAQRVLSMLWTALLLVSVYRLVALLLNDRRVALLCAVLVAFDYHIMVAGAFGRYDPMVAALGFGAYVLYLALRERNLNLALLLANTSVMLCGATHPNGLLYFTGLWVLVFHLDRRRIRLRQAALCAIPYAVGAAVWSAYLLQDPQSAWAQLRNNSYSRVAILEPWQALRREVLLRYGPGFGLTRQHSAGSSGPILLKALPLLAYLVSVLGCLSVRRIRSNPGCRTLLLLTAVHVLYLTFFEGIKFPFYLVHIDPLYAILLGVFAAWLARARLAPKWAIAAAVGCVMAVEAGGILWRVHIDTYGTQYAPAVDYVKRHAAPNDLVLASCDFGFGYGFKANLRDDPLLGYDSHRVPQFIVWDVDAYQDEFDHNAQTKPAAHRYVAEMLRQYDTVFHNAGYTIYRRRPDAAAQPPSTSGASFSLPRRTSALPIGGTQAPPVKLREW